MNKEKKIDLKDKMLSDDNLDQVSGGANVDEMRCEADSLRQKQSTEGLTANEEDELLYLELMGF